MKNIMAIPNKILNLHLFLTIITVSLGGVVGQLPIRCFERERQALLDFKHQLYDEHGVLSSWGTGKNRWECCTWRGVHCHNQTNHVTQLNLRGTHEPVSDLWFHLRGKISSSLLEMKHLTYLDLSFNSFLGSTIPEFTGSLGKLQYLNLSGSYFYGPIPPSVGNLSELKYLDFSRNYILYSDSLDWVSHLGSLKYLDLSNLRLENASDWLQAISRLTSIEELRMAGCGLQVIPPFSLPFINSSAPLSILTHLDLSYNQLGEIPQSLGNMSNLKHLNLKGNHLTPQLSDLMINLFEPLEKKLEHLDLGRNEISGPLPNFSRFSFLNHLDLGWNKLNGSIPDGFLNIPYLIHLDLSANNYTGTIPYLITCPFLEYLYLGSNNFEGIVTETHLFNLSLLQLLDLSSNSLLIVNISPHWVPPFQLSYISLSGCKVGQPFPQWLQFQRKLEIFDISSSQIVDTVPHWFGNYAYRLRYFNASNNDLRGILPDSFFKITSDGGIILDLSRNKITGQATFLCHSEKWALIDLSDNLFFGHLPNCFANSTWLTFLNLANNRFIGGIQNSFDSCESLHSLNLRNNNLSGGIPTSMRNCTRLEMIDLGENMLTGNIPTWIGDTLPQLIVLSLNLNEFNGTIPSSICSLQSIQVLDLSSNMISGPIPKCLYNLSAMTKQTINFSMSFGFYYDTFSAYYNTLRDGAYIMWKRKEVKYVKDLLLVKLIDLSNNLLVGDIPSEIPKLVGLVSLNLSTNNLHGQIPQNIGQLRDLNTLDLSRNHLSGSIPVGISELSFLGVLDLSYNNLSGRIPPQLSRFEESTYAGNSELCGHPILNKSCPGENDDNAMNKDDNAMNKWEHEDDKFITKGFYICLVFGFGVGFWGIIGTILFNKSARFAYLKLLNTIEDLVYVRV